MRVSELMFRRPCGWSDCMPQLYLVFGREEIASELEASWRKSCFAIFAYMPVGHFALLSAVSPRWLVAIRMRFRSERITFTTTASKRAWSLPVGGGAAPRPRDS